MRKKITIFVLLVLTCEGYGSLIEGILNGAHDVHKKVQGAVIGGLTQAFNFNVEGHFGVNHQPSPPNHGAGETVIVVEEQNGPQNGYGQKYPNKYGHQHHQHQNGYHHGNQYNQNEVDNNNQGGRPNDYRPNHGQGSYGHNRPGYNNQQPFDNNRQPENNYHNHYNRPNYGNQNNFDHNHGHNQNQWPHKRPGYNHHNPGNYNHGSNRPNNDLTTSEHPILQPIRPGYGQQNRPSNPNDFQNPNNQNQQTPEPQEQTTKNLIPEQPPTQGTIFNPEENSSYNPSQNVEKTTKKSDEPLFVPLQPNEYNYGGEKIEVNAPKRETNQPKPTDEDEEFPIDIRVKDE